MNRLRSVWVRRALKIHGWSAAVSGRPFKGERYYSFVDKRENDAYTKIMTPEINRKLRVE
jgi:hypothetical protein